MKTDTNWLTSLCQYPLIHMKTWPKISTELRDIRHVSAWHQIYFTDTWCSFFIRYEFPDKDYIPFLSYWRYSRCDCTGSSPTPDMSSPFIAYYTIVQCSSFKLIVKGINRKDMIKHKAFIRSTINSSKIINWIKDSHILTHLAFQ